jgi:hypothetical protein
VGTQARGHAYFGPFDLDLDTGELRKHGIRIGLQKQPLEVLALLSQRPGDWLRAKRSGGKFGAQTPTAISIRTSIRPLGRFEPPCRTRPTNLDI